MNAQPELMEPPQSALEVIQSTNAAALFDEKALKTFLNNVTIEVRSHQADTSTSAGRDAIKSLSYKCRTARASVKKKGIAEGAEYKKKLDMLHKLRRMADSCLENLSIEVREPLDVWEAEEKARIIAKAAAAQYLLDHDAALIDHGLFLRQQDLDKQARELEEAENKLELERLETERIASLELERKQQEIKDQQDALDLKEKEFQDKLDAQAEKERLDQAEIDRQEQAKKDKIEADRLEKQREAETAQRLKDQAEQAVIDQKEAVAEALRQQDAAQKLKDEAEQKQRDDDFAEQERLTRVANEERERIEADEEHRADIRHKVAHSLSKNGIAEAMDLTKKIDEGDVDYVSINYS